MVASRDLLVVGTGRKAVMSCEMPTCSCHMIVSSVEAVILEAEVSPVPLSEVRTRRKER